MKKVRPVFFLLVLAWVILYFYPDYADRLDGIPWLKNSLGQARALVFRRLDVPVGLGDVRHVAWSPDGQRLLFAGGRLTLAGNKLWGIYDLDLSTRKARRIADYAGRHEIARVVFSSAGDYAAVEFKGAGASYLELLNYQISTFMPIPLPTDSPPRSVSVADSPLAFLPDGRKLLFTGETEGGSRLYVYDINQGRSTRLPLEMDVVEATWSPAGDKILLAARGGKDVQILLCNPDGSQPVVLVSGGVNRSPRFSHFGQKIAFFQDAPEGDSSAIGLMKLDTSELEFARVLPPYTGHLVWSYDGNLIYFQARKSKEKWQLYQLNPTTHHLEQMTSKGENLFLAGDPQGNRLAFVSARSVPGLYALYLYNVEGGDQERLTGWFLP